ncbi:MAG: NADH-quinone oxidoreductase subunit L, partial [Planctomycetaceae bacterium]
GITAFYMFRLWFYTFAGQPRDQELHDHAHESPWVMTVPLLILAVFAAFCAAGGEGGPLFRLIQNSEPHHMHMEQATAVTDNITHFGHDQVHKNHATAGYLALIAAVAGTFLAYVLYCLGLINPGEIKKQFASVHTFLVEKWRFDELYDTMFVRPVHVVASWCTWIDTHCFDALLHTSSRVTVRIANWDRKFDERFVDGAVDFVGAVTTSVGTALRTIQTGKLRQYVMFIAVGLMALFVVLFVLMPQ